MTPRLPPHVTFRSLFVLLLLVASVRLSGSAAPTASPQTPPPITNADVIAMVKAGVAADSIMSTIDHAAKKAFDLSKDGRAQLAAAGVSSEIIDVMRGRKLSKSVREAPVQPIPFTPKATPTAPAQAPRQTPPAVHAPPPSQAPPATPAPRASPAASPGPALAGGQAVTLPLAAIEVKHFTQADGLDLSAEFLGYYHAALLAALPKTKVAGRVVDDGGAMSDAEARNAVVVEGRILSLKKGSMVTVLKAEISLYRRSDRALIKTLTVDAACKSSPLNKDKNIAEATGANTAPGIQQALKKG